MKTQTHTPTPKVIKPPTPIRYRNGGLMDAEETSFASVPYEPVGQYIVHAVNAHEELLQSLRDVLAHSELISGDVRERAVQAIAKAEGSDGKLNKNERAHP